MLSRSTRTLLHIYLAKLCIHWYKVCVMKSAFDENSQGGWAAAPGFSIPIDSYGGYAST